jgi:hypothetical protein
MSVSKRRAAAAEKILESKESSAHTEHNGQMTTAERAQTLALNSEITNSVTEAESKNRERNGNENEKLLCERDKELGPRGFSPRGKQMLVNPL